MYVIGKRMPKKYDIQGDLREALYQAANDWIDAIGNKDFMGGNKPNLADLSVYGVIGAIHGTQTLLTIDGLNMLQGTNAYKDLLEKSKISDWYSRMSHQVGESSRLKVTKETSSN